VTRRPLAAALLLALAGCPAPPRPRGVPAETPLAIKIIFDAPATTARARVVSTAPGEHLETPWYSTAPGPATITALGLKPATEYAHTVQISTVSSAAITLHAVHAATPALPPDVARFAMTFAGGPSWGYLLVGGMFGYEIAFDPAGNVRWYRAPEFVASGAAHPTQEWKIQYDGSMTAFVGSSRGWEPEAGAFVRFTPQGTVIARYSQSADPSEPGNPALYTDPHELHVTRDADGREWLHYFAYLLRPGPKGEPAAWHELLRTTADGRVVFRWKAWEHMSADEQTETLPGPDVDHPNSLEIAPDGDYIASFRNTDQVLKIDSRTGAVVWRLGGRRNEFRFEDPLGGFFGQHSVRVLWNGNVLLYDNGLRHDPKESRAAEYAIDEKARTATLVWEYRHVPPLFTEFVGSVQRVSDETIVAFSLYGRVCGVDRTGKLVWEASVTHDGAPAKAYRIRWVPSLYEAQVP
jgi:hypothetical protein